jgi:hypothetical protein
MADQPNELARRQILAVSQQALKLAGVYGELPTPLDAVGEAIGVAEVIDVSQLPDDLIVKKPSALKKILGAYFFPAETAFVDFSQPEGRARFIQAHELGHRLVPWHAGAYLDDEQRLFRETEEVFELEASLAGAHLILQGRPFLERALEYPVSLKTPLLLADLFKASLHATIHYYIEQYPEPVAGLIAGRIRRADGTIPIWRAIESATFRSQFGPLATAFPTKCLLLDAEAKPLGPLLVEAQTALEPPAAPVVMHDLNRVQQRLTGETFYNQRCYFVMLAPQRRLRSGRRIRVAS